MRRIVLLAMAVLLVIGCDNKAAEGPKDRVKYRFSSKTEFTKYYLPLQNDHGGIKSWKPSKDQDCRGGKVFTLADGHQATFCPADGDESLFK